MTSRPSEDSLIARYFAPLAGAAGLGRLDDAACLPQQPGQDLGLPTDSLVTALKRLHDDGAESALVSRADAGAPAELQ